MDFFKAMLYSVNTGNRCTNPAPLSWVKGYQEWQIKEMGE